MPIQVRVAGQQPEQGNPDTVLHGYFHQLFRGDTERYNVSSVSLVYPKVSSQMGMETPPQGDVQQTF